jgi:hypothetical protein
MPSRVSVHIGPELYSMTVVGGEDGAMPAGWTAACSARRDHTRFCDSTTRRSGRETDAWDARANAWRANNSTIGKRSAGTCHTGTLARLDSWL